ncbi:thiol:disulfide interchange protein DsbD [Malaciobacter pacificus]|uniref:Thiol:disulfide interchange protein DsbD n=1 Tax=Malaciobacter pacificus TaxID=1080223 RepID=A0A5C2H997_9BACT|nr:protein-disulfide reductase DsbD [Malaciobacter pacificus]QEP35471.1 thiol:disulfide interchange protein DsbD [Malaciobacter pacificus]GGD44159.1 thiol:disulfide interchange protein DsbD [Malaciobacter pacificus]
MKKIVLILLTAIYAFGLQLNSFLEPDEAFQTKFEKNANGVVFSLVLGNDIYLYDDKIKVLITKPEKIDITEEVNIPEPIPYEEWIVQFDNLNITIPHSLLKSKIDSKEYELEVKFQGCSKAGLCYAPMSKTTTINLDGNTTELKADDKKIESKAQATKVETKESKIELNETDTIANTLKDGSIVLVLATFFGFGLLLALTPCVFPMIPILSSIIVKAGSNEKMSASKGFFLSLVYVLAMSLAYTIAGVIAGLFGANLQAALQNPWVLSVFAAIFVALAFSMFGYYQIELPQSIQAKINKTTDGKENQGIFGIAIMGFLSALIVGPCVAPPLAGALVYIGQTGDAVLGGLALFVMSLGMGVPLLLIGLGAGKFMPKPGGWMENVTKIFGIVMLAVAIWLLDRVLNPSITMTLWALLFIGFAVYLKVYEHILVKIISIVSLILGAVLLVGAISGATNPLNPLEKFTSGKIADSKKLEFIKVKNLAQLEDAVKKSSKPVMLDFWATWCVSCKELDNITFKDERVMKELEKFTLLKADVTDNNDDDKALQAKYGIVGPPALVFFDTNNNEIKSAKIVGYKNPEQFLEILNKNF